LVLPMSWFQASTELKRSFLGQSSLKARLRDIAYACCWLNLISVAVGAVVCCLIPLVNVELNPTLLVADDVMRKTTKNKIEILSCLALLHQLILAPSVSKRARAP
jgi:hypothetical protein